MKIDDCKIKSTEDAVKTYHVLNRVNFFRILVILIFFAIGKNIF